jgi:hypothetical protein
MGFPLPALGGCGKRCYDDGAKSDFADGEAKYFCDLSQFCFAFLKCDGILCM